MFRCRRSYTEVVGSAYWMAPECLHGKEYCEKVGVVTIEQLLGVVNMICSLYAVFYLIFLK